jgi:hypothetical protein
VELGIVIETRGGHSAKDAAPSHVASYLLVAVRVFDVAAERLAAMVNDVKTQQR